MRTVVQRKAYFHLTNDFGSNLSCPVYPLARAFTYMRTRTRFELMLLQAQKLVLGKGLLFLFIPVCVYTMAPSLRSQGRRILFFKQRFSLVSTDQVICLTFKQW